MKNLLIVCLSLVALQINAQKTRAIYLSGGLEMGNYLGMFWDVNYIYKDKYSFTIAQQLQLNYANQRPDDMVGVF